MKAVRNQCLVAIRGRSRRQRDGRSGLGRRQKRSREVRPVLTETAGHPAPGPSRRRSRSSLQAAHASGGSGLQSDRNDW